MDSVGELVDKNVGNILMVLVVARKSNFLCLASVLVHTEPGGSIARATDQNWPASGICPEYR